MNEQNLPPKNGRPLHRVIFSSRHISANTRLYQLCWDDHEVEVEKII